VQLFLAKCDVVALGDDVVALQLSSSLTQSKDARREEERKLHKHTMRWWAPAGLVGAGGLVDEVLGNRASVDSSENEAVYDQWADSYSASVRGWGYDAPEKATSMLLAALSDGGSSSATAEQQRDGLRIIDVGTGLHQFHPQRQLTPICLLFGRRIAL
jgi:hypothetical protein